MAELPRPDVDVTHDKTDWGTERTKIEVTRDGKSKSYEANGITQGVATREAVKKLLDDPYTAEWLPSGKRP